jgi:hypothetical protein
VWRFVEEPWQYRVLDRMTPGIDLALLERTLRMTPTERLQAAEALMAEAEQIRAALLARQGRGR